MPAPRLPRPSPNRNALVLLSAALGLLCLAAAPGKDPDPLRVPKTRTARYAGSFGGFAWRAGATLLAIGPGGRAFTCDGSGDVRVWDSASGRQLRVLQGPQERVSSLALSPRGDLLATGGVDGSLVLRDASGGQGLRALRRYPGEVFAAAFTADGRWLVSGGESGTVRVWDVLQGRAARAFEGHTDWIRAVATSTDAMRAYTGGDDGTLRVWDLARGRASKVLGEEGGPAITALAASMSGRLLLAAVDGKAVELWEEPGGTRVRSIEVKEAVLALAFSPDNKSAWVATESGRPARRAKGVPVASPSEVRVRRWSLKNGALLFDTAVPDEGAVAAAFSRDRALALTSERGVVRRWDLALGDNARGPSGHTARIQALRYSPDGARALSAARDGSAKLWDAGRGTQLLSFPMPATDVKAVAFSPDGATALVADVEGNQRLFDVASGTLVRTLGVHRGLQAVAFSASREQIYSASYERLGSWDARTGGAAGSAWFSKIASAVAFSADGRLALVANGADGEQVRESSSGRIVQQLHRPGRVARAVALSPDGSQAVVAAQAVGDPAACTLELWDAAAGRHLHSFGGHSVQVDALAVAPGGRLLLTAGADGVARLWVLATGKEVDRFDLRPNGESPTAVAFSPDGLAFSVGSSLGAVRQFLFVADPARPSAQRTSGPRPPPRPAAGP